MEFAAARFAVQLAWLRLFKWAVRSTCVALKVAESEIRRKRLTKVAEMNHKEEANRRLEMSTCDSEGILK